MNLPSFKNIVFCFLFLFISNASLAQYVNFAEALQKSLYFYDAEKSGPGISGGRLEWRGDSEVADAFMPLDTEMTNLSASFIAQYQDILDPDGDGTVDVSGGYHDAGDHVKFGLPQSYSASTLGWAYYEFKDAFVQTGEDAHMEEVLRWFTDYFLRSTFRDADGNVVAFCYQVGEGSIDHNYWGPPELQRPEDYTRPAYFATSETPASDQAAGASAALALMYLNMVDTDLTYAQECLEAATALYDFAVQNRGLGYDGGFYNSSFDEDELSWAAIWLHIATGQEDYLTDIVSIDANGIYRGWLSKIISTSADNWQNIWVHSWDTVWGGLFAKLAPITDDPMHWYIFRWNLEYWSGIPHQNPNDITFLQKTPAGYSFLNTWGSARYNSAAQFQALVYRKYTGDERFADWAKGQMEYLMGDNPLNKSYIVGYSDNHVMHPHHRAAHGSKTNSADNPTEHLHTLWGALVGGPGIEDEHIDNTNDYIYNEVAIDYNAGFVGALAGHKIYYGQGHEPVADFPPAEPKIDEFFAEARIEQENTQRSQITITINNESIHAPRFTETYKVRYFFDISEMMVVGQTIDDITFQVYYDEQETGYDGPITANGPFAWDADNGVYYMEFDWSGYDIYGSREYQFALMAEQGPNWQSYWDASNDFSRQGMTDENGVSEFIPVYVDGELVFGQEPGGSGTPIADFTASTVQGLAPLSVDFDAGDSTDPDGGILTYSWDFGDGTTGTGVDINHVYSEIGSFVSTLVVTDPDGNSDSKSITIVVQDPNDAPEASFTASAESGLAPLPIDFDASASIDVNGDELTYTWDFGDGTTGTGVEVSHEYTVIGSYTVILTVSDGAKEDTATKQIEISDGTPTAKIEASTLEGQAPLFVEFDGSTSVDPLGQGLTYTWVGSEPTLDPAKSWVTYTEPGIYEVILTVTNALGEDSELVTITVTPQAGTCDFGTPLATALPTTGNTSYDFIHVLGEGGPSLDNVTNMTINWDLQNNGLWQFSVQTNNGQPSWWNDLRQVATHSFGSSAPEVTFSSSGFVGLDGSYYAALDGDNFVLVSIGGGHTLYFSNSATAPNCTSSAKIAYDNLSSATSNDILIYPNPSKVGFTMDLKNEAWKYMGVYDLNGALIENLKYEPAGERKIQFGQNLRSGIYLLKVVTDTGKNHLIQLIKQ